MQPDAKGRFCASCQKSVTDFSTMPSAEILAAMASSKNICGRIGQVQLAGLNSELALPKPAPLWKRFGVAAAVASLVPFMSAKAQTKTGTEQHIPTLKKALADKGNDFLRSIKGKVFDAASKQPVAGAELRVKGNSAVVLTDAEGGFEMAMPSNQDSILLCSYMGHITKEININKYQPFYHIEVKANALPPVESYSRFDILVGGIDVVSDVSTKSEETFWWIQQIFK